jgi:RHS repeat-associated protein
MSASPVGNYYIYSFDGRLLQVYDVYGALQKDFVYMGSRLVAEYDHVNTRLLYYAPDQINSTRVVTDGVGNVVYSATYDPYGNVRTETGSVDPMPKFSGKERDAESQLDYFGARYYDRSQYRFVSHDPVIRPQGCAARPQLWNLYTYCRNNPQAYIDYSGAASFSIQRHGPFLEDYGGKVLGNHLGGTGYATDRPLDIRITMNQAGKYSIDVKVNAGIFVAKPTDLIWKRLDALIMNQSVGRTIFHENKHLDFVEEYVLKRLKEFESTLKSDKVTEELHQKIWQWMDEAKIESENLMDSVLGLQTWAEQIYFWTHSGWGNDI